MKRALTDNNPMQTNIDPKEIAKFSSKDNWWNKEGDFKPLHDINPIRLQFIQKQDNLKNKTLLDVGCGGGILAESLTKCGAKVTGIDMNEQAIEQARAHAQAEKINVDYQLSTIEEFAKSKFKFDIITCMELLEHVPDPTSIINAARKLIKPNGQIFFATINRNPKAFLFAIIGAEYLLHLLPKGTHTYEKFIRPSELSTWLQQKHFSVNKICGMHYNPITKIYSLSKDVSVNYLLVAVAI